MEEINNCSYDQSEGDSSAGMEEFRRGPWTVEEDFALMNYIAHHGEGRWNALSRCAGLKRSGKSCRLRWLNYLRPDVRRGNITLEEQLLILELHSRWGNRWSKIAQHLPGRTDNEIKNYWRTRVQKHAKQLKCDVNSKQFKDTMRYLWMPRLVERIQAASAVHDRAPVIGSSSSSSTSHLSDHSINTNNNMEGQVQVLGDFERGTPKRTTVAEQTDLYYKNQYQVNQENGCYQGNQFPCMVEQQEQQSMNSESGYAYFNQGQELMDQSSQWINGGDWYLNDEMWFLQLQEQQNPLFSFS